MKHILICSIFSLSFLGPSVGHGQSLCVNDRDGSKGASNQDINKSVDEARDPLMRAFLAAGLDPASKTGYCGRCLNRTEKSKAETLAGSIQEIADHGTRGLRIKLDCIEASMQRSPGNQGYSCYSQKKGSFNNSGATIPCLNQKTVNLVHYALNEALVCMSSGRTPIDARFVLKKINNETAFNFFVAYGGGKGMGQLTSDAVNEIAGWNEGGKFIKGNAGYILEELMASSNPSCAPFKEIMERDLRSPPPTPGNSRNSCAWVAPGSGLARNLIYSLGYYVHMRDRVIKPYLAARSKHVADNSEIVDYLTLVAYGPGGQAEAKSLIDRLRVKQVKRPMDLRGKIIRHSSYVKSTEEKMTELLKQYRPEGVTDADVRGDTCLE